MAFETGTATDTFDLMSKLNTFMAAQSDWTLISSPKGGRDTWDYDKVYYSTGSSGKNDIYIRQRVGEMEQFLRGAQQWDHGGGDTGFLNFFTYSYYPTGGDGYSGAGEAGTFGPRLYWYGGNTNFRLYRQDILSQRSGGSPHIVYSNPTDKGSPSDTAVDTHCKERRRWVTQTGIYMHSAAVRYQPMASDGHRNIYHLPFESGNYRAHKYSLQRLGGYYKTDGNIDRSLPLALTGFVADKIVFVENRTTRKQFLYLFGDSDEATKLDLSDNTLSAVGTFTWDDGSNSTDAVGAACWDGGNFIYILRGDSTPDWAMYDIRNNTWRTTMIPEDPQFRRLPVVPTDYSLISRHGLSFIDKNVSGYSRNRLYISHSTNTDVLYMDLDDETGVPYLGASWQVHGDITGEVANYTGNGDLMANRYGKMFHFQFRVNRDVNGIYEQFPNRQYSHLLHTHFADGNFDWTATDGAYHPEDGPYSSHEFVDGYACRVRTSIGANTTYIFIADEDRVIVATQSYSENDGSGSLQWSVAYMGAFESAYNAAPYGEIAEDLKAGFSRKVKLDNASGEFAEGSKYFIIDTTGASYTETHPIWNNTSRYVRSEFITVEMVEGDTITISPKHSYSAGSKIAMDPIPTGVFFWELEKFQATNIANVIYDDRSGSDDPSKQTYTCAIPEVAVNTSAAAAVASGEYLPLWDYTISTAEAEGEYIGTEVRGKMIGVYALGNASGVSSGQTIAVGDDSYYIIGLPNYNKLMAIGPITVPQVPVTLPEYNP